MQEVFDQNIILKRGINRLMTKSNEENQRIMLRENDIRKM